MSAMRLQNEYSLLVREAEKELVPALVDLDLGFIPTGATCAGRLLSRSGE